MKKRCILQLISSLVFCGFTLFSTCPAFSDSFSDDRLTPAEENYAYNSKNPSQRVRAFLKIANSRVDALRKATRKGVPSDPTANCSGYSTALEGAWMAVSWGKAVGINMQDSVQAITRSTTKHLHILQEIQANSIAKQEVISHFRHALLRSQSLEQAVLNLAKSDPSPLNSYEEFLTTDRALQ